MLGHVPMILTNQVVLIDIALQIEFGPLQEGN